MLVKIGIWIVHAQEFYRLPIASSAVVYGDQVKDTVPLGAMNGHSKTNSHVQW